MPSLTWTPFSFPSADGEAIVSGFLHEPADPGPLTAALIACHGRWNDSSLPLINDLCRRAAEAGIRALRFDFRYVTQQSQPSARGSAEISDLEGALVAVKERFKPSPGRTYLAGKSLGAVVASHVAAVQRGLGGYIALGYPLHAPGGQVTADLGHLARLGCPALFVVGDRDPFCRIDHLRPVLDTIPTSCTLEMINGGDHSYRPPNAGEDDQQYLTQAIDVTLRWLAMQLGD